MLDEGLSLPKILEQKLWLVIVNLKKIYFPVTFMELSKNFTFFLILYRFFKDLF